MTYTEEQVAALGDLRRALARATEAGALDALDADCQHPHSINDVCDAVEAAYVRAVSSRPVETPR